MKLDNDVQLSQSIVRVHRRLHTAWAKSFADLLRIYKVSLEFISLIQAEQLNCYITNPPISRQGFNSDIGMIPRPPQKGLCATPKGEQQYSIAVILFARNSDW